MKTIGYMDLAEGRTIHLFNTDRPWGSWLFMKKKNERIENAFKDLRHMGNIAVYLIKGRKYRLLYKKRY